jgi:hypothetical protein
MLKRLAVAVLLLTLVASGAACGDDGGDGGNSQSGNGSPTVRPGLDATEEVLLASLSGLGNYVLTVEDVPPGHRVRSNQPVSRRETAVANVGITSLAEYINDSDMQGAWATLMTRDEPASGLSSIIYVFATPEGARGLVDTVGAITPADYPGAATVEHLTPEPIGDATALTVYRIAAAPTSGQSTISARTVEVTWAQGRFVGQVIIRYPGDVSSPDEIALINSLARIQAERMASLPQ